MMDDLVTSLPDRRNTSQGYFRVMGEGDENNVFTGQNVRDASNKNWLVQMRNADGSLSPYTGGIPTTIRTADADVDANAPRYNMSGQRVGRDYKGVVIVNGRKVVK